MASRNKVRKSIFLYEGDYETLQDHYEGTKVTAADVIRRAVSLLATRIRNQPIANVDGLKEIATQFDLEE